VLDVTDVGRGRRRELLVVVVTVVVAVVASAVVAVLVVHVLLHRLGELLFLDDHHILREAE